MRGFAVVFAIYNYVLCVDVLFGFLVVWAFLIGLLWNPSTLE